MQHERDQPAFVDVAQAFADSFGPLALFLAGLLEGALFRNDQAAFHDT
jgi:hypothetical protein